MFRKFVIKRIIYGILMYTVMVFVFSTLFNSVADTTMRAQIEEQLAQDMMRQKNLTQEQRTILMETLRQERYDKYHLNDPLIGRIFFRAVNILTFNFQRSTILKTSYGDREVIKIILEALPRTLVLFSTQIVIVTVLGVIIGMYAARKPNGFLDRSLSMLTMTTNGVPTWWLAMIGIMVFAYVIPLFPSGGFQSNPVPKGFLGFIDFLWHLSLPLLTLVMLSVWRTAYLTRNIVLSNLQEDFVMAARARGIPEKRVLFGHTLRTSMPAIMTMAILSLFASIAGNILVEGIFGWPGIGNLYFVAVEMNDVPVLMATLSLETLLNMLGLVLLDIIYGLLDPRIKVGAKS